jgi:hypothetical protein
MEQKEYLVAFINVTYMQFSIMTRNSSKCKLV